MMSTLPTVSGVLSGRLLLVITAASDMNGLPDQGEIQGEGGSFARTALHADVSRMFLDDAVGDRKSKTGAAILTFRRRGLGGEEWVVNTMDVLLGDDRTGVGNWHRDEISV